MSGLAQARTCGFPQATRAGTVWLGIAIGLAFGAVAAAQEGPRLVVVGEGQVRAVPDRAVLTLGAEETGTSAAAALEAADAAMAAVLAQIGEAGVAASDIQTDTLSVAPIYDETTGPGKPPEVTGYVATTTARVRVGEVGRIGAVIDAAAGAGANSFRGIAFALADADGAEDEARRLAVADAIRRAGVLARAAGETLGPIVAIREGGGGLPGPARAEMLARGAAIAPGEIEVGARVTLIYELAR